MSDDFVNIEINGKPCKAKKGEVIIKATDRLGPDASIIEPIRGYGYRLAGASKPAG